VDAAGVAGGSGDNGDGDDGDDGDQLRAGESHGLERGLRPPVV
jgi:hypothetical protein